MRAALFLIALPFLAYSAQAQTGADRRQLAQELRAEVEAFRSALPMRDGLLTISRVDLRDTEIVYTGTLSADFDDTEIATFRREVRRGLCTGGTADVIRRGGAFTYDLEDEGGERFVTTVSRCD